MRTNTKYIVKIQFLSDKQKQIKTISDVYRKSFPPLRYNMIC